MIKMKWKKICVVIIFNHKLNIITTIMSYFCNSFHHPTKPNISLPNAPRKK